MKSVNLVKSYHLLIVTSNGLVQNDHIKLKHSKNNEVFKNTCYILDHFRHPNGRKQTQILQLQQHKILSLFVIVSEITTKCF
jgi:hypothetical protein